MTDEIRLFDADVLVKRSEAWAGGKAVLMDRQPRAELTQFAHCLKRHTIVVHTEGANTSATVKYDGSKQDECGSTIGQIMLIPAGHRLEGVADYPSKVRHLLLLLDPTTFDGEDDKATEYSAADLSYRQNLKDGMIAGQMWALQNELDRPGPLSRLFVESLCCEIAIRALRICTERAPARATGGLAPRRLRVVKDYMEANLSGSITLSDLSALRRRQLARIFPGAFHMSAGIGAHR